MPGDEVGSKLVRFLYFIGAGVICTKAINVWNEYEHKQAIKQAAERLDESSQPSEQMVNGNPVKS